MPTYQFSLEPLVGLKLEGRRFQVKQCPCGKSNRDGKFVPFKGIEDRGYCHSCGVFYSVAKHTCPECRKDHAFSRYVDSQSAGAYLHARVGKCLFCSYHYTPKQFFADSIDEKRRDKENGDALQSQKKPEFSYIVKKDGAEYPGHDKKELQSTKSADELTAANPLAVVAPPSFIAADVFKQSLKSYEQNHFLQFLNGHFGTAVTNELISRYFIGTSMHWRGATVFWQIDNQGKIRTGKIMLYRPDTGKRSKERHHRPTWAHKAVNQPEFSLQQCFFGEHLLRGNTKTVAIVESEKTAIIASVYLPQFVWIAAGSKTGLNETKCQVLMGRNVVLFPDISPAKENQATAFELWTGKAREYSHLARFRVSDLLERKATVEEREQGLDLADYLLRFPVEAFRTAPLHLSSNEISGPLGNNYTGPAFSDVIIQGYQFKNGKVYDVLFNACGELIRPGEHAQAVNRLAAFFKKTLRSAQFDSTPCWVHEDNQSIVNNN